MSPLLSMWLVGPEFPSLLATTRRMPQLSVVPIVAPTVQNRER